MESAHVTECLVSFIKKTGYRDFSEKVLFEAKKCILDGIGVTLAGSNHEAVKVLKEYISEIGGKAQATTIGINSFKTSVVQAALVNGVACHVLDFDDTQNMLGGHPTTVMLPAVLAIGEYIKASGKDILTSFILGVEIASKIGRGVNPSHYQSGYHVTSTIGIFGAVASAGKLLGLGQKEFLSAFGIAGSMSSGLKENFGTMTKSLHAGLAASNGVAAALLAQKGYTASENIIEGELGFGKVLSKDCHFERILKDLGNPWEIEHPGITRKKFPSCARTHSAIDALLKILDRHPIQPQEVEEIECATDNTAFEILIHPSPKTPLEAKFSMPYCLAMVLLEKNVSIHHFDQERLNDPRVVDIMKTIKHIPDKGIISKGYAHRGASKIKMKLKNGKEFYEEVERSKGHPENPLSYEEIVEKFSQCLKWKCDQKRVDRILFGVEHWEDQEDISNMMKELSLVNPE